MKGLAELTLLVAVCAACWTRTPVGAIARAGLRRVGDPTAAGPIAPDLLASFRTELPARFERAITRGLDLAADPGGPSTDPTLSPGWTPALRTAVAASLGAEALAVLEADVRSRAGPPDGCDVEAALERWAVGEPARQRAIRRARAAGVSDPVCFHAHRRFLSDADALAADRAVDETLALATVLDLSWPVDPAARITSGFGPRIHPTLHTRKLHEGVDIAVPTGTPVHAAGPGTVVRAGFHPVCGRSVKLDHGHAVTTTYCHGDRVEVAEGQRVRRGDEIMRSGSTGRSTGPHLHFGLRVAGRAVDPSAFRGPPPAARRGHAPEDAASG